MGRRGLATGTLCAILAAGVLLLAACAASGSQVGGGSTPPGGDPGNKMLRELASDPVFATLPPSATRTSLVKSPAEYRKTPFQGEGWDGPSVVLRFTSSAPVVDVFRYYKQFVERNGWAPAAESHGITIRWSRSYADAQAVISLSLDDNPADKTVRRAWALRGSIGPRTAIQSPTTRGSR